MIHKASEGYSISSHGSWRVGLYECKRSANYAFRFDDSDLKIMQLEKNKSTGLITFEDLKRLKQSR